MQFILNIINPLTIMGIRIEFFVFAITLISIALFHKHVLKIALGGLVILIIVNYLNVHDFSFIHHLFGHKNEKGEWLILLNLAGLLTGFSILARHFEDSYIPQRLPDYLPDDWKGGFVLLLMVFVMSSFIDNIAGALIGGSIANSVFNKKLHIGYIAAIIAASNAGGAGSVIGDTTTTMMWIEGISPYKLFGAYIASSISILIFGIIASIQQDRYHRIRKDAPTRIHKIDKSKILIVIVILAGAVSANVLFDLPAVGVWLGILAGAFFSKTSWKAVKHSLNGTIMLISLVLCASLVPVNELPSPTWQSTFVLGLISAIFDNIPLTKLCLEQGGYVWSLLAYAVGFGGSILWFGSSAGVALSDDFPEIRNTVKYLKSSWYLLPAYIISFFIMLLIVGWNP